MAIEFVTAYRGEAHVTADDVGGFQRGICGVKDYVLSCGKNMEAELVTNNTIKIHDGEAVMQGRHWRIKPGTYDTVTISNGSQGMRRKDMIVARYTKGADAIESIELLTLKGTPVAGNAVLPVPATGSIQDGALKHEMPLYAVELNGLNVVSVMRISPTLINLSEIKAITRYDDETVIGKNKFGEDIYRKVLDFPMTDFTESESMTDIVFNVGTSVGKVLKIDAIGSNGITRFPLPYAPSGTVSTMIYSIGSNGEIHVYNKQKWGADYTLYITIEYSK